MMYKFLIRFFLIGFIVIFCFDLSYAENKNTKMSYAFLYIFEHQSSKNSDINKAIKELQSKDVLMFKVKPSQLSKWEEQFYVTDIENLIYIPIDFLIQRARNENKQLVFSIKGKIDMDLLDDNILKLNQYNLKALEASEIEDYDLLVQDKQVKKSKLPFIEVFVNIFLWLFLVILISLILIFAFSRKQIDKSLFDD